MRKVLLLLLIGFLLCAVSCQSVTNPVGEDTAKTSEQVRYEDAKRLKAVGLLILAYLDIEGKLPKSFDDLRTWSKEGKLIGLTETDLELGYLKDYLYIANVTNSKTEARLRPIAMTKPSRFPKDFVNVFFLDGHVEGYNYRDYQATEKDTTTGD